jgi:hypothetical protein
MNEMTDSIVVQHGTFIAPVADVTTALRRYQAVKDFIGGVLKEGTDYGKIPGGDKPALLKPGAEKMATLFGLRPTFPLQDKIEDWSGKDHDGEPFFYYRYKCQLWRDGELIAEGEGSCNSWEKKYRYRQAERICPKCGKPTIIKGKEEYGGGWLCYAKKGGCGAKFADDAPEIVNQQLGQIKNADPADIVNTLQKMAQKRALVAPVLIATNTSDYFTQDIDDFIDGTVVDMPPMPEEPQEPTQDILWPAADEMSVEVANAFMLKDSKGKPYGDHNDERLGYMGKAIEKKLKEPVESDEQDKLMGKLEAISIILDWRKHHS